MMPSPSDSLQVVPVELLQTIAAEIPTPTPVASVPSHNRSGERFDVAAFIQRHGLEVDGPALWNGEQGQGQRWTFRVSPMCGHGGDGPYMLQHASGAVSAGCHHDSCTWTWGDLRQRLDPCDTRAAVPDGYTLPIYRTVESGTIVKASDKGENYGDVVSDNGTSCTVHFVSPQGQEATKEIDKQYLLLQDGTPLTTSDAAKESFPSVLTFGNLATQYPALRPEVIHGLLRRGEICNSVSVSKVGKSWLVSDLALAVTTGRRWLDSFDVETGDVLILDNELHPETLVSRIRAVADARWIDEHEFSERLHVVSFRGQIRDIFELSSFFSQFDQGQFVLLVVDALYRFLGDDIDENSNAGITRLYNQVDQYAAHLDCAVVCVHHASKGNQSGKSVTDVGAGAGAQSRAADSHLILRPHSEDNAVVLDAVCRSFPPVEPRVLRWEWPVWSLASDLDPSDLRPERARSKGSNRQADIDAKMQEILDTFVHFSDGALKTDIRDRVGQGKIFNAAWLAACNSGHLVECEVRRSNRQKYPGFKRVYRDDLDK